MPKKGVSNNPNGKPKGTVNKTTALAREAIARFVDGNIERLQSWLDQIAADDPKDAFNCFKDVMEYHLPKQQRTTVVGDGEENAVHVNQSLSLSDAEILNRWREKQ